MEKIIKISIVKNNPRDLPNLPTTIDENCHASFLFDNELQDANILGTLININIANLKSKMTNRIDDLAYTVIIQSNDKTYSAPLSNIDFNSNIRMPDSDSNNLKCGRVIYPILFG